MIQASSPRPKRAIGVRLHARSARRSLSADVADGCPIRACCEGASGMARALRCRRGRHRTLSRASPRMSSPSSSLWTTGATAVLQQSKRRPPFQAVGSLGADASAVRAAHVHRRWAAAVATARTAVTGLYAAQDGKPLAFLSRSRPAAWARTARWIRRACSGGASPACGPTRRPARLSRAVRLGACSAERVGHDVHRATQAAT